MGEPQKKIDNAPASQNLGHADEKHAGGQSIANEMAASKAKGRMFGNKEPQKYTKNYDVPQYIHNPKEHPTPLQDEWEPLGNGKNEDGTYKKGVRKQPGTNPQQEAEIAGQMSDNKQRQLAQIAKQEADLERDLRELDGNLTIFKNGKSLKLLAFFRSPIDTLINGLLAEAKKPLRNLNDNAKAKKLETLVAMISSLMVALNGFKIFTATLDAVLLYRFSVIRVVVFTLPTIILPIIFLVLSPIYLIFLIPLLWIGKFPLLKGPLTDQIIKLLETLRRQKYAWTQDLKTLKKKLAIKKQLKELGAAKNQIQGRLSVLTRPAMKTK